MKKIYLSFVLLLFIFSSIGQTVNWNFGTTAGNASYSSTSATLANVTISPVSQGNNNGTTALLDNQSASSTYAGASGAYNAGAAARTGVLATGPSGSAYFQFTVTPDAGLKDTITAINFGSRSTGTGPRNYAIRTSLDDYTTDVATAAFPTGTGWNLISNPNLLIITGNGTAVTVRIYGFNGSGNPTTGTANWRIDDLAVTLANNTVTPPVTPTVSIAAGTNAAEPATNGSFTVTLSQAAPTGGIAVAYTLSGTATAGTDYSDPQSGSITIAAGATTGTININVIDDTEVEGTETIVATITTVPSSYAISTTAGAATISLLDNDNTAAFTPISYTGSTYIQNFNTLATTGTSAVLPIGWALNETGTNANTTYAADAGTTTSGNTYSYGVGTTTERSFGTLRSGSLSPTIGAVFTNNTGSTISTLIVSYTGKQWRVGAANRADRLDFQYSTNATSLNTGNWTDVDALDFTGPVVSPVGAVNGDATGNNTAISFTITGLSIANGSNFVFRWNDYDASGADDGLAVDNFTLTPGCTPPTNQPTALSFTPALQSVSGSFTNAATGAINADHYLVIISNSATLTEQPSSGTTYALDDVIGGGRVVAITDGTTNAFTANDLTPGTTYYFFVYAYAQATECYNITTPLTGSQATTTPPPCTAPTAQISAITAPAITANSISLSYTRGNGDNVLILARSGSAVNAQPINSVSYATGSSIGSGNTVIYNGPAASFDYTGLTQNTAYYFALYEYSSATNCYLAPAATASFTTACSTPVNVTSVVANGGNAQAVITWNNPTASCFDEVLVVVSTAAINGTGDTYTGTANPNYTSGGAAQVVYRSTGNTVTVTGLANSTNYFIKVFTRLGSVYSSGVAVNVSPFDPASGYVYLYGNMHAHSSFSDGNKDNLSNTPNEDFAFARDAQCMDYMGMSEHNHAGAGMSLPNYHIGYNEANSLNLVPGPGGNSIVTLWGMEWGTISGGGHVLVYGFDNTLLGWESGNYDQLVPKSDYPALWTAINNRPGAVGMLAHPNSTDFSNVASSYNTAADNAIVGVAMESGPAFSTSTAYNDAPSRLGYLNYFKTLLARGYHLAPDMDMDNHNMTFGRANANRTVVLATAKTREAVMEAFRSSRFYASQDCNLRLDYRLGTTPMGSGLTRAGLPNLSLSAMDIDGEEITSIELWGGVAGNNTIPAAAIKTYTGISSFSFGSADAENTQPNGTTYYYYVIVTEADGDRAVSAPIWYTRNETILPVTLLTFNALYNKSNQSVDIAWSTTQEVNSKSFVVERSVDGNHFTAIATVAAAGNSQVLRQYHYDDSNPINGISYYRLRQVDLDGKETLSRTVRITTDGKSVYAVYPNPAKGYTQLYSTSTASEKVTIVLMDNLGRTLNTQAKVVSVNQPASVDVSHYNSGTYFIKIINGNTVNTEKIIIQ